MTTPHDKALSAAVAAFNQVVNEPQMIKCDRCDGKGYHHGFGEDGVSPDWCIKCGGNQFDVMPGEEERAMQAAISAYLSSIGGIVCAREPVGYAYRDKRWDSDHWHLCGSDSKPRAFEGRTISSAHLPIEAGNAGDGHFPAPRGGVEPNWWEEWVKTTRAYNKLAKAAQDVIDETDRIHDSEPAPVKYRAPYGSITKMREILASTDRSSLVGHGGDGWLPIETAPKDGTHILLYAPSREFCGEPVAERLTYGYWDAPEHGAYLGDCGGECRCPEYDDAPEPYWFSYDGGFTEEYPPTHWRPLPPPPSPSNEREKP